MANVQGGYHSFGDLVEIMKRLRGPGGCPWDAEQTMDSLRRYILEEAHELIEAIEDGDLRGIREECGDVLLQVVFVSEIARTDGAFDIDDVTRGICRKLVDRHPHVFSDLSVENASEVLKNWEKIKEDERRARSSDSSALAGIPRSLPSLLRARRIQERAARKGFDWKPKEIDEVWKKLSEELDELRREVERKDGEAAKAEFGDLLFSMVNVARHIGVDPESALQSANEKFSSRFRDVEGQAARRGVDMRSLPLAELDEMWNIAKSNEAKKSETT